MERLSGPTNKKPSGHKLFPKGFRSPENWDRMLCIFLSFSRFHDPRSQWGLAYWREIKPLFFWKPGTHVPFFLKPRRIPKMRIE